jgi:hypothetical protein
MESENPLYQLKANWIQPYCFIYRRVSQKSKYIFVDKVSNTEFWILGFVMSLSVDYVIFAYYMLLLLISSITQISEK